VVAIFFNILLGGPLILLPVQILWMNLVTDGMTAVALGLEPAEKGVMHQPPRRARARILDRLGWLLVIGIGLYIGLATLWLFHHTLAGGGPERLLLAQTMAFTGIIVLEKVNVFNFRTLRDPIAVIGALSNRWVLAAWAGTMAMQVVAVYVPFFQKALHTTPLGWQDWGLIAMIAAPVFIVVEFCKWIGWRTRRKEERQESDG
jgi:Ca2+-transporting ATPase